jgi:hypothetical protein
VGAPWFGTRGLRAGRGHHAVGLFRPPGPSWPAEIRVLAPLGTDEERRVLLHEMVHLALFLAGHPDAGHGERFAAELERVGARRGAEPVEVAGP